MKDVKNELLKEVFSDFKYYVDKILKLNSSMNQILLELSYLIVNKCDVKIGIINLK